MTPCSCCLPTRTDSSCAIPSPNVYVHICMMTQTLVYLWEVVKSQDMALVLGMKSMKKNQAREMQAATFTFVCIPRGDKSTYKAQVRYIPVAQVIHSSWVWSNQHSCILSWQRAWQWRHSHARQWQHQPYTIKHETTSPSSFEISCFPCVPFWSGIWCCHPALHERVQCLVDCRVFSQHVVGSWSVVV